MTPPRLPAFGLLPCLLLLTACASQPTAPVEPAAPPVAPSPETVTRPFDRDTLLELLVAEFAAKRERPELTLGTYIKVAERTRDPAVAERASGIARFMAPPSVALDAALLWTEVDTGNPSAHEAAATQLIRANRLDEAMDHVEQLLESNIELNFDFLLNATRGASPETLRSLTARFDALLKKYPTNHQLWFSRGLLRHEQDASAGMDDIDESLRLEPRYVNAIIAKSRLLEEQDDMEEAETVLRNATLADPANKRFGLSLARLLLREKKLADAQDEFERLSRAFPDDTDLTLSLALVAWENKAEEQAIAQLEKLVDTERGGEAHSYLGRIATAQGRTREAVEHFSLVPPGPQFNAARIQMAGLQAQLKEYDALRETLSQARQLSPKDKLQFWLVESELLGEAGEHETALKVLDAAGRENPDEPNIRYAHAMLLGQMGKLERMETELRAILLKDPDNTDALNALGYTLADQNRNLTEAADLIGRAYAKAPENPAIIDSMGWLKYRQGDLPGAATLLRKAYASFPDHEVAAHLGEVLWVQGQRDEALKIWQDGLSRHPTSTLIGITMKRLGASLP
jgi:tetratricopeptide (TPR) repeat protein